ncbi:HAD family hydrolase [Nakamurella lactea]|uniref:HAD family hydrolase n=1 Tax=Nakamurella lactea TaxID=459515 RepID=UPI0012B606BE|nr:HAD family hydrolase [Nakamurella lactea]
MSNAPRMIVTDLDGTLLNEAGRVSDRNAAALRRAREAGALVVVATGRPVWWLNPVLDVGFEGTAICMNGAVVFDVAAEEMLDVSPLTPQTMHDFVEEYTEHIPNFALAVERLGFTQNDAWSEQEYDHPWDDGDFRVLPRSELLSEPAVKMLLRQGNDSSVLAAAAKQVAPDRVSVTYSTNAGLIEVAAAGVNKGAALHRLAERFGVEPAEAVAFGDMPNDAEMLRWAGRSFAMSGAHPIALAAASDTAPDNDSDGVAQVLERWF